ncbi:unnamed protein product [Rhizoctonia solani]|uniref:Small ribosomal subunit protein eS31 domain-containing protein n=1 Tax=Rhizoctonia solani TaxID=456999 RepID=A0A8H3GUL3_9AGAM|nr:unnamed protein product [Rhizoctonia solani]
MCEEAQKGDVKQPQDQACADKGQYGHPQALQGRLERHDQASEKRMPEQKCGAGVFMAFDPDRQYCGKYHLTCTFAPGTKLSAA